MNALEEQENEILVLNSILDAENINCYKIKCGDKSTEKNAGRFVVDIDLTEPVRIEVKIKDAAKFADVTHLPPIYCSFTLPTNYPLESSPEIDLVAIWLPISTVTKLKERFAEIWSENFQLPVLYLYYQCIKDEISEFIDRPLNLNSCKLSKPRRLSLLSTSQQNGGTSLEMDNNQCQNQKMPYYTPEQLFEVLVDYNRLRKRKLFEKNVFLCQICFTDNYGNDCVQFSPCDHIFCRSCCRDYFNLHIKEGTFGLLTCMATSCESQATPHLIREVVDEETYERYERLTFTRSLDMMRDVVICPRPSCRSFVLLEADDPKMGWCSVCTFAFCTLCNKVYHGVAPCAISINDVNTVVDQYIHGDEEVKNRIEERFGKVTIKRLIDDASSLKWQKENCQECPCCRSPIEKKDGCNKMWCSKCGSYFCWLCLRSLPKDNPYNHFNDPNSTCFNALFRGVPAVDDDSDDDGW